MLNFAFFRVDDTYIDRGSVSYSSLNILPKLAIRELLKVYDFDVHVHTSCSQYFISKGPTGQAYDK